MKSKAQLEMEMFQSEELRLQAYKYHCVKDAVLKIASLISATSAIIGFITTLLTVVA